MQAESSSLTLKLDLTACCLAVFRKGIRNLPACCRGFAISTPARNASGLDASATVLQTLPFLCSSGFHPLQSLWIDLLVLRLLNEPKEGQKRAWFVIDELASLQKLPQLHTAITENRKSNNPVILGFQGKAQLEYLYGHLAEVMLSQPATSIWLKTKEPTAGEWVSKFIGKVEIERLRETHFDGSRAGRNFALDR